MSDWPRRVDGHVVTMTDGQRPADVIWLHRSLGICGYLERVHLLSSTDRALLAFAIMRAQHAPSCDDELLVTFGGTREDLRARVSAALASADGESRQDRKLKATLCAELLAVWTA